MPTDKQTESCFCESCPCGCLHENRLPILACFDLKFVDSQSNVENVNFR